MIQKEETAFRREIGCMRTVVTYITAATFLAHMALGCCWVHHSHACGAECHAAIQTATVAGLDLGARPRACGHSHPAGLSDEQPTDPRHDAPAEERPTAPTHQFTSHGNHCVGTVPDGPQLHGADSPGAAVSLAAPVNFAALPAAADGHGQKMPALGNWAPPVRAHLLLQVLLI